MQIKTLFTLFLCFLTSFCLHAAASPALTSRPEVKNFIQHMVQAHHFDAKQLQQLLNQATLQPSIIAAISKPAEAKPWDAYEKIFITPKRIQEGIEFWQHNQKALSGAQKKYGVPAEMIIAIIGVETFYGKNTGQYNVIDALVTLAFDYPPRAKFFLSELEQFLLLAREEGWDPKSIKGSYAGAMGNPQFIASSYRHYAVDFNNNGKRDLLNGIDDSIGSVANYFRLNGWQPGAPVVLPAKVSGEKYKDHIASKQNPKPSHSLYQMSLLGVQLKSPKTTPELEKQNFALVALQGANGPEFWLGAQNFYVITRYNRSDHYAMAVYTLSQKIKEGYKKAGQAT